jgi:hypothetical protein
MPTPTLCYEVLVNTLVSHLILFSSTLSILTLIVEIITVMIGRVKRAKFSVLEMAIVGWHRQNHVVYLRSRPVPETS